MSLLLSRITCVPHGLAVAVLVAFLMQFLSYQIVKYSVSGASPNKGRAKKPHLVARLLEIDLCDRSKQDPFPVTANFTLVPVTGGNVLSHGDFFFERGTKSFKSLQITITRCVDAVSFNTCEYYDTWKYAFGVCGILTAKGMPWSDWMLTMKPLVRCPFRGGAYSYRFGGMNASVLEPFMPKLENTFWISHLSVYDEFGKLFTCLNFTAEYKRVRD